MATTATTTTNTTTIADPDQPPSPPPIPVVDLRLLSQSDLYSLSTATSSSNHHNNRPDDVIIPKIDKTVFNESAEAIASNDLWIWHTFFGTSGMNNDVNVLRQSPLFNDLKAGKAPDVPFVANNMTYKRGYCLTDGIYSQWSVPIISIKNSGANDHKRILYKTKHEAARKDVERVFGVLKKK
nr:protein ALP1-like [Tanacetum cinerariifolium]